MDEGRSLLRLLVPELAPGLQLDPQPVQGLPAKAGPALVVEASRIPGLPAAGQDGGTGGLVAVAGRRAGEQVWMGGEDLGIPAGRRRVPLLVHKNNRGNVQNPLAEEPLV